MTSRITLYSEKQLIKEIKAYAREHNTSVSKMVNGFFRNILDRKKSQQPGSRITDSLTGILSDTTASKETYHAHLVDKYQ